MTIRQVISAFGSTSSPASGISFKGRDSALATSMTLPTHASGDMILMAAQGVASVPSGWTLIKSRQYMFGTDVICGYKVATGSSEVSGTWTGATELHAAVYDGVASIGASASNAGSYTITWPALTLTDTDGSSWVAGFGFNTNNAPSGMTKRGDGGTIILVDTATGVSSFASRTSSGSTYIAAFTIELVSE